VERTVFLIAFWQPGLLAVAHQLTSIVDKPRKWNSVNCLTITPLGEVDDSISSDCSDKIQSRYLHQLTDQQ